MKNDSTTHEDKSIEDLENEAWDNIIHAIAKATKRITKYDFIKIAEAMVEKSGGRLRLAFNEDEKTSEPKATGVHFLKLNEKRVGQSMELYGQRAMLFQDVTLPDFFEVLLFIKIDCIESYNIGSKMLKDLGELVYKGELLKKWNALFEQII